MRLWRRVAARLGMPARRRFSSEPMPIDRMITLMSGLTGSPAATREQALSIPTVQKGRNLICSVATLPLKEYGPDNLPTKNPLFRQIDPNVANVVTLAQTLEDLLFDSIAWWRVLELGWDGFPLHAEHLAVNRVSLTPPGGQQSPLPSGIDPRNAVVYVDGIATPATEVIRFDSPNPGFLMVNGRVIRKATLIDQLAAVYANDPRPLDYFTAKDGADPEEDEVKRFLDDWRTARKERSTAFVPAALDYNSVTAPSPRELQLAELQKSVGLEIANALGVDPEELGISTTSRTYANATDRRKDRINDTLAPFMRAITDRLSMGDVTKRGYYVDFDLDDYLKPDPKTRVEVQKAYLDMEVITVDQIAAEERLPAPPKPAPAPAAPVGDDQGDTDGGAQADGRPHLALVGGRRGFSASARPGVRAERGDGEQGPAMVFAGGDFAGGTDPATVDVSRRTITGLAVPYNKIASKYGLKFRFRPGSLHYADLSRVKHYKDHWSPVGVHESVKETSKGPVVVLRVLDGVDGSPEKLERDQLLYDAANGLYDGLSVGVDFSLDPAAGDVEWNEKDGVYDVVRASWRETSSTPMPAFDDARVTKVVASRGNGDRNMPCTTCGQVHAEGVACTAPNPQQADNQPTGLTLNQDQITALLSRPGALQALVQVQQAVPAPATATPSTGGGLTLSADQLDALVRSGQLGVLLGLPQQAPVPAPAEQRAVVDPTRRPTATLSVREPDPYRFDTRGNLGRGTHDFSTDLIAGSKGDKAALGRAQSFVRDQFKQRQERAQFDTDMADVSALNPNRQRPDLYVDQRDFQYPMWDAINKGSIEDATPFVIPKFNSASGMVGDHTEGVEPTPGTFTATSQTITPTPVSGKVQITREAWDQGGNPQMSGLIWRQMTKAWYEALEAAAVAALDAVTPTAIALTAGGGTTGQTLDAELTAAFAALQFVRGGFSMTDMFTQIDLYKALVAARDNDGRRLYPAIGAVNSSGTARSRYSAIDVNGVIALPAWALAATGSVVASSYLFDRESVAGWATAPQMLEFQYEVRYVNVALWGYKATGVIDLNGVREITYDPVP